MTQTITDQGGVLSLGDVAIEIPPGALSGPQSITITRTDEPGPPGYESSSALYRFDPEGLVFARPATLRVVNPSNASDTSIIWSQGGELFEPLATTLADGHARASIVHFSRGFLGKPACEHAASCVVAGSKCTFFESRCDGDHPDEKRVDCECSDGVWLRTTRERSCGAAPDAGSTDAADAAVHDAGESPPPTGPVAWYRFDDLGGTKAANSGTAGSSLDGIVGAGVSMGAAGRIGGAFHFDGTASSLVTVADPGVSPLDVLDAMTIELWVRPDAIDQPSTILSKMSPAALANAPSSCTSGAPYPAYCADTNGYLLDLFVPSYPTGGSGNSWLRTQVYTPADPAAGTTRVGGANPSGPIAAGTWYHVALVTTGSLASYTEQVYFNATRTSGGGCTAGASSCNFLPSNDVPLTIGGTSFGSFKGSVDDIKIWKAARTPAEICADAGGTFGASGCSL